MDAFFASVAQQQEVKYKGKPVITGSERAVATSVSYEAKALGIKRCTPIFEIKKHVPQVIILPSDYETIGLFSLRIFDIVRNYTAEVEEYSVDECFADITGMDTALGMTYEEIAQALQRDIQVMLGATGSIGLAPTKTLAKIASKWKKPHGCTVLEEKDITCFLSQVPLRDVWGIGKAHEQKLTAAGMKTALDFVQAPEGWVKDHLAKPGQELWQELQGRAVIPIHSEARSDHHSICRHKTFWPNTNNERELLAHLCQNIENACLQLRRYGLVSRHAVFGVKRDDFSYRAREIEIPHAAAEPQAFIAAVKHLFRKVYKKEHFYRATFFNLYGLRTPAAQSSLFEEENIALEKQKEAFKAIDEVNQKFGKHTLHLGASLRASKKQAYISEKNIPWRRKKENWLPGETQLKKVDIPYCGWVK